MAGFKPGDVYAGSSVIAFLLCVLSVIVGYRYGVVRTKAQLMKNSKKPEKHKTPERFRPPIPPAKMTFLERVMSSFKAPKVVSGNDFQEQLFGPTPKENDKPILTITGDTVGEAKESLLRALEIGAVAEIEETAATATVNGVEEDLVKVARLVIRRLTDAYLGFDGPGALHRRAAALREHNDAVRRELEEAHSERRAAEGERAQFEVDRQRFEEEMAETRRQHENQILAFEIKMEQEREAFKQEAAQGQEMHERMMDMAKGDMDQARLAFAEEVENWTKKRNAELTDIHRIRREMDADGAKRASDLATFAANVTRALSGLEYALAKQDEDTGEPLDNDAWSEALVAATNRAEMLSWSQMPEVHEMFRMAHDRMKAITANVELKKEIQKRLDEPSPVVDTGLEFILLKLRGLEGLDIARVNHAVALAKLRLAINMGSAPAIKIAYVTAVAAGTGKEPFLQTAAEIMERCAATEVLLEALDNINNLEVLRAAAKAGERVLHNIEKWNAANPADPEAPAMDLMLVTQVLQATGLEFGRGVEGLTLGLQKTVKQANAAIQTLGSLEKWKEVPEEELLGNTAREELTEASDALLELTWPSDNPLKPVYAAATSRSKALEADEALLEILERRLANPDAAMSIPIDFVVQSYKTVPGASSKIIRQAQLVSGLKDAMLTDDTKLMVDVIRMLAFPSGAAPALVTAATAQLHRLNAQEALMMAIDRGELREVGGPVQLETINALTVALGAAEKALAECELPVQEGAREHLIVGNLPQVSERAKLYVAQLKAVYEMQQALEASDSATLTRAVKAGDEAEANAVMHGAKTSVAEDLALQTAALGALKAKQELALAVEGRLLPRVKAALDVATANHLDDELTATAAAMLANVNAVSLPGAFRGHKCGGRRTGATWLQNPHFVLTVEGADRPVTLNVTLVDSNQGHLGVFAIDARVNKKALPGLDELLPDNEKLQESEYNESISELELKDVDPRQFPIYLIPSCFIKDTEGDFTITVMSQTHGVTLECAEATKLEDKILNAMRAVDADWTENAAENASLPLIRDLMSYADVLKLDSAVVDQGHRFLNALEAENELYAIVKDVERRRLEEVDELPDGAEVAERIGKILDGLPAAGGTPKVEVNTVVLSRSKQYREQLQAEQFMRDNTAAVDVPGLEYALQLGADAECNPEVLSRYTAQLKVFKAEDGLRACVAGLPQFDFDTVLAAVNTAQQVGITGPLMDEASSLLEQPGQVRKTFDDELPANAGPKGTESWSYNPQYKIQVVGERNQKVTVSLRLKRPPSPKEGQKGEKAPAARSRPTSGESSGPAVALHVLRMEGDVAQAGAIATEVAANEYDGKESMLLSFHLEVGHSFFVVPSVETATPGVAFTLEVHQPCQRTTGDLLCVTNKVDMLQSQLKALLPTTKPKFGGLSTESLEARDSAAVLLKTCGKLGLTACKEYLTMRQRLQQLAALTTCDDALAARDSSLLKQGISECRAARTPADIVHQYEQKMWEADITDCIRDTMEEVYKNQAPPLTEHHGRLQAYLDICDVYAVTSTNKKEAGQVMRAFEHTQVAHKFATAERSAVGRIDLGQWRDNPQLQIDVEGTKPVTVALSVVRDAMKAVKEEGKKKDSSSSRKSGKKDKKVSLEGGGYDEGSKEFDRFAVHVVRNRAEWPLGGVGVEFEVVAECEYSSDGPKAFVLELNPKHGPFFVVPSTYDAEEEGWFTVSMLAIPDTPVSLSVAKAAKSLCKLQGEWHENKGGCYSKNGASLKSKSFKVGKTWLENPQFRVHLNWDAKAKQPLPPGSSDAPESAHLTVVVSTPIEDAELGVHLVRNTACTHHEETFEALPQRYHKLLDRTPNYAKRNEIYTNFVLKADAATADKAGAQEHWPFFVVPSLHEKLGGKFYITFYSDEQVGIELVDPLKSTLNPAAFATKGGK